MKCRYLNSTIVGLELQFPQRLDPGKKIQHDIIKLGVAGGELVAKLIGLEIIDATRGASSTTVQYFLLENGVQNFDLI